MAYDFNKVKDRKNTNSLKWDVKPGELPLWVADMDFETAPCVKEAIEKRAATGIFGYSIVPDEWAQGYSRWWKNRHDLEISSECIIFCTGVVPAISSLVRKLTTPAEKVLVQTPCYNIFFNSIVNNGRFPVESPLFYDGKQYSINFEQLEKDLSDPQVSLMILCNPQNPTGNIWSKNELAKIGELCKKYAVTVISDEIHCDITAPGLAYTPFATASETCKDISVTCIAPTKCFNIAGINSAATVVFNPSLRHKVWRALNTDEVAEPNAFAVDATIAAFADGEEWLGQLNEYLFANRKYAAERINALGKNFNVVNGKATYLLWVDVKQNGDKFAENLRAQTGLYINGGSEYGKSAENFIRINLACPRKTLEDAMNRLEKFVNG